MVVASCLLLLALPTRGHCKSASMVHHSAPLLQFGGRGKVGVSGAPMQLPRGPRRRSAEVLALGAGPDLISALPDDLLLLVLARLPCVSAAARAAVLSRRWRSLWARLRRIVFRDVPFPSLQQVLVRFPLPPPAVSLIHIRLPDKQRRRVPKEHRANAASFDSLLRAAARLEPEECVFELLGLERNSTFVVDLPRFHRAASIVLNLSSVVRSVPAGFEFAALETLSLSSCTVDIDNLLSCCPRLRRLLLIRVYFDKRDLTVNSASLEELLLDTPQGHGWIQRISIVAPVLEQLTMSFSAPRGSISISAPMVKKVRWHCDFSGVSVDFNLWAIQQLTLQAAEGQGHLPSLHIHASAHFCISLDEEDISTPEIEKHMVAEFSALELHLTTNGHVFGAFAFHLLGMNQICSGLQRLKVVLQRSEVEETCSPHCPCESTDWRSQTISLAALEEVEIDGFGGADHEIDFLKLIFKCAPLLKRVTVKLSNEASSSDNGCTNIYNIFKAHSPVELYVYPNSDYESERISICLL